MSREDEIRARLEAAVGDGAIPWTAVDDLRYLLDENARLRAERAEIVAFLRSDEPNRLWANAKGGGKLSVAADAIERGAHRPQPAAEGQATLFVDGEAPRG